MYTIIVHVGNVDQARLGQYTARPASSLSLYPSEPLPAWLAWDGRSCLVALVQPLAFGAGLQPVLIRRGTRDQGTKGTLRAPSASNNASFACYQGPRHGRNGRRGLSRAIGVGV